MHLRMLASTTMFCAVLVGASSVMAAECCECGTTCKLKKFYRPVVTLKPVKCTKYDYCTACREVLAPTTSCVPCCGGCQCGEAVACDGLNYCDGPACCDGSCCDESCCGKCACFGQPKTITVPVAVQKKCGTYTRMVPCVTWVVECRCVECCKKCKEHHSCLDCLWK